MNHTDKNNTAVLPFLAWDNSVLSDLRQVDMLCQVPLTTDRHTRRIIAKRQCAAAMFHKLDTG